MRRIWVSCRSFLLGHLGRAPGQAVPCSLLSTALWCGCQQPWLSPRFPWALPLGSSTSPCKAEVLQDWVWKKVTWFSQRSFWGWSCSAGWSPPSQSVCALGWRKLTSCLCCTRKGGTRAESSTCAAREGEAGPQHTAERAASSHSSTGQKVLYKGKERLGQKDEEQHARSKKPAPQAPLGNRHPQDPLCFAPH